MTWRDKDETIPKHLEHAELTALRSTHNPTPVVEQPSVMALQSVQALDHLVVPPCVDAVN
jgi:hypothetical protein